MPAVPEGAGAAGVRAATPSDLYAAHAFLPWIASAAVPLDGIFVAHDSHGIAGAGALSTAQTGSGLRADIFVHPAARRRGLGTGLLRHLVTAARAWGAGRLRTWRPTDDASATAFLVRSNALPTTRLLTFEAPVDLCALLGRRFGTRGAAMASGGALRLLRESDLPGLATFYAAHLGEIVPVAIHRLRAMLADPVTKNLSVGYEREGMLRGFAIFRPGDDGVQWLDFWYVDPAVRGISASALIVASVKRAGEMGVQRARFQCRDDARSTLRMAREIGAVPMRTEVSHELVL